MKTIKYIAIFIVCVLFAGELFAQDLETYKLQLPDIILEKGGPIYVSTLTDNTQEELNNNLSEKFQKEMIQGLQAEGLAFNSKLPSFNPWMRTNLYSTTDNQNEASYVISGDYRFTTKSEKSYNEKSAATSSDSLPFVYYEFSEKSTASVVGNVIITDVETNSEITKIPFNKELSDEKKKIMQQASVKSPESFISSLSEEFIKTFRYRFSAVKTTYKYEFPKIKPKDKDLKKAFREYKRNLKDLADNGKLKEMFNVYVEIQQKEDSPEVNESIGICYEILGNYSKASEYYAKCDNVKCKNRLNEQIATQNKLRDLGFTIDELEF